jgi:hypothetical protein
MPIGHERERPAPAPTDSPDAPDLDPDTITVIDWVWEIGQEVYYVDWYQWHTHPNERTCPECIGLNGDRFEAGQGPFPPLHDHCRCTRDYWGREKRTRMVKKLVPHKRIITNPGGGKY